MTPPLPRRLALLEDILTAPTLDLGRLDVRGGLGVARIVGLAQQVAHRELVAAREHLDALGELPVLVAGGAPLVAWLPLIRAARGFSDQFWAQPTVDAMLQAMDAWFAANL